MEEPLLSICIPTYNRADLLDYCLEGVREFERFDVPFEVVVSDNASEDHTQEVLRRRSGEVRYLKTVRQKCTVPVNENSVNAIRNASGRFIVYLADDDSLIPEAVVDCVRRMVAAPALSTIYADWIAYDDAQGRELHRNFRIPAPASFRPEDPLGLVDFVLRHTILPEIGIYRRDALLKSDCFTTRSIYAHLHWMYRLSRTGEIAFELAPFYREHRVLKPQFQRATWNNLQIRHQLIGDEFRNTLETLVLWALQDSGHTHVPQDQFATVRQMIDNFLTARVPLEIRRAVGGQDWLLAAELRRRLVLWHGPGSPDRQRRDVMEIVLPAALQAVAKVCQCLSGVAGLLPVGFHTPQIADFFRRHYPAIALLDPNSARSAWPPGQPVALFKDQDSSKGCTAFELLPGHSLWLDELLETYRVNTASVDLGGF